MDTPKNWPDNFLYLPIAIPIAFHEVILEAFLGTGYDEDREKRIFLLEEMKVYPHLEIRTIDEEFCSEQGKTHPLLGRKELAGHAARGVVATEDIPENTILGEYGGVISFVLQKHPELSGCGVNPYLWQINAQGKKIYIDGFRATNELGFINEYRGIEETNNTMMKPVIHRGRLRMCYVTRAPIVKGQELLTDYNPIPL